MTTITYEFDNGLMIVCRSRMSNRHIWDAVATFKSLAWTAHDVDGGMVWAKQFAAQCRREIIAFREAVSP